MGKYVDGFLLPVPKANVEKYRALAQKAGEIWKEHGALDYVEAVGDDLDNGDMISFKTLAGASEDEAVIFAYIVYESKEDRDRINKLVMEDSRMKSEMELHKDAFDFKKMAYGGFSAIVAL